jgi:biopolymer transport protein ExbB
LALKELIGMGGWAMWPLMFFSVATLGIILEKIIHLLIHNLRVDDIHDVVLTNLEGGSIQEAENTCRSFSKRKVGASIFLAGIKVSFLGESRMEKAMETEAADRIGSLESGFNLLVALGSIAPITGFLGTVSGMIGAFKAIANAADVNAQLVAGGIFEALITTAFGLAIAIVAITGYNVFAHVVDKFAAQVEKNGSEIVTRILILTQDIHAD